MHKFGSLFALLLIVSSTNAQVNEISFTKAVYDGKGVDASHQPVVKAITKLYPKATFKVTQNTLLVGLPTEGNLNIKWQSDCPVNSQFQFQGDKDIISKVMKPVLVAWTQMRHKGFEGASVNSYVEENYSGFAEVVLNKPDLRTSRK